MKMRMSATVTWKGGGGGGGGGGILQTKLK